MRGELVGVKLLSLDSQVRRDTPYSEGYASVSPRQSCPSWPETPFRGAEETVMPGKGEGPGGAVGGAPREADQV